MTPYTVHHTPYTYLGKLVSETHFGGGILQKKEDDQEKSWKDRMEEMIHKSKAAKVTIVKSVTAA